jgi:pimeloyl-ACP methyl ester carboxylesterase
MAHKLPLRDLVVIVPGIMGSVLEKNGEPLWAVFPSALATVFGMHAFSLADLMLASDDPERDDLGDGVQATRLIPNSFLVGGLVKVVDGYSPLIEAIHHRFELSDNNFLAFPYDWRRDNRVSARKLKREVDRRLAECQKLDPDARVILLAHSMGGLVCQYYLEALEGWKSARALITFGTPFRGAVDALGYLANGYKKAGRELVEAVRSFTSTYQLLPVYEAVQANAAYARVAELDGIPNISRQRCEQARTFHDEIEAARQRHGDDLAYLQDWDLLPIVGTGQPTAQSARLDGGVLNVLREHPPVVNLALEGGDGTVPRVSALPPGRAAAMGASFRAQRHDALQADPYIIYDTVERIAQMQAPALDRVRGQPLQPGAVPASITVELDDVYAAGEPVTLRAALAGADSAMAAAGLDVSLTAAGAAQPLRRTTMHEDRWVIEGLAGGLYQVDVASARGGPGSPPPVRALVAVEAEVSR